MGGVKVININISIPGNNIISYFKLCLDLFSYMEIQKHRSNTATGEAIMLPTWGGGGGQCPLPSAATNIMNKLIFSYAVAYDHYCIIVL